MTLSELAGFLPVTKRRTSRHVGAVVCGRETGGDGDDYLQVDLRVDGSTARQTFGAHRSHLQAVLAPGFRIEIESES